MKNTNNKWKQKPLKNVIKKQNNNIQKWYINHIKYDWNLIFVAWGTHIFELWRAAAAQLIAGFLLSFYGHTKNFSYRLATTTTVALSIVVQLSM